MSIELEQATMRPATHLPEDVVVGHVNLLIDHAKHLNSDVERMEALQSQVTLLTNMLESAQKEAQSLQKEVDRLTQLSTGMSEDVMRNAERYRWLRSAMKNGGSKGPYDEKLRTMLYKDGTGRTMFQFYFWCRPEQLDSSIDDAMLQKKQ